MCVRGGCGCCLSSVSIHCSLKLVQGGWRLFAHLPNGGDSYRAIWGCSVNKRVSQYWTLHSFGTWSNSWENLSWPRSELSQLHLKSMSFFNSLVKWKGLGSSSVQRIGLWGKLSQVCLLEGLVIYLLENTPVRPLQEPCLTSYQLSGKVLTVTSKMGTRYGAEWGSMLNLVLCLPQKNKYSFLCSHFKRYFL